MDQESNSKINVMDSAVRLTKHLNCCLLPKLSRNFEEYENPAEYVIRENNLREHFQPIIDILKEVDFRKHSESLHFITASLLILYRELKSSGSWNTEKCTEYSDKLSSTFDNMYGVPLDCVLKSDKFNTQEVFDILILDLYKIIIIDFKKYPALIDVYYSIIQNVKTYKIVLKPVEVLPICLLLIDDYVDTNKIKGLECCISILQCLNQKDFIDGNYYEVIYGGLKKTMVVKDVKVTKLVLECLLELIKLLPPEIKSKKLDDAFSSILEQLYPESNIYRKTECFRFIRNIIKMHGINIVNKRIIKTIICDNIQICSDEAVANILLNDVLQCLETWVKYCWCVWRLPTDHRLLSTLFTLLFVCKKEFYVSKIHYLIVILISLSKKEEQKIIFRNLAKPLQISSELSVRRFMLIKRDLNIL